MSFWPKIVLANELQYVLTFFSKVVHFVVLIRPILPIWPLYMPQPDNPGAVIIAALPVLENCA